MNEKSAKTDEITKAASENFDPEEVILQVRSGSSVAFSLLCDKYRGLIMSLVNSFSAKIPADLFNAEDLSQEALMAFYKAALSYNLDNGSVTFGLYAKTCIRNKLISVQRKAITMKRRQSAAQSKRAADHHERDVLSVVMEAGEELLADERINNGVLSMLTDFEISVLQCFVKKMTYAQIAERLSVSTKAVDNALYRIRKKLKKRWMAQ